MVILEILKAIILGVIQGVTEWLPISSTGHMIIVNAVLNLKVFADETINKEFVDMFIVVIQLGSILAVLLLYFNKLNPFSPKKSSLKKKETWNLWFKVIIAAFPAAIVGVLFDDYIDALLYNPLTVSITLILYGVAFIVIERRKHKVTIENINQLTFIDAFKIGAFQMLALIPGTSRSGSTILGAILIGTSRTLAAEFSFFLAIPMMFGASLLKLIKLKIALNLLSISVLATGLFVAFIVSIISIKLLMKYIKKNSFEVFGYYRIILGILVLLSSLFKFI